jgi:hypothetical protein
MPLLVESVLIEHGYARGLLPPPAGERQFAADAGSGDYRHCHPIATRRPGHCRDFGAGNCTAVAGGVNDFTGIAVVEAYILQ